jgi:hypothetical protein
MKSKKMTVESIAQVVHEIQVAFTRQLSDYSLKPWSETPEDVKAITIAAVKHHTDYPEDGAKESHDNWVDGKIVQGWKYGPVKDAIKKEHPSLIPFAELPLNERIKDALVVQTIHSLIKFM